MSSDSQPSDQVPELIELARAGNRDALDQLFGLCRNYLQVVARVEVETSLRSKVDPSDVVQQTLLEAHRGFGRFQGTSEAEWMAWLRKILSHNAADFVRFWHGTEKRKLRREVRLNGNSDRSSQPGLRDPAGSVETPSKLFVREERERLVADAVAQLPDDYREVILLRNLQRLPFDEVARRMGRSRPAVQMLWTRAIRKLQQMVPE